MDRGDGEISTSNWWILRIIRCPFSPRRRRRYTLRRKTRSPGAGTAAEYNLGPTAVLKNALDYAYAEWSNKPVAFVGYGGVGGSRAVEQLRLNVIELQMAPIRSAVHILFPDYLAVVKDGKKLSELDHLNQTARQMLDQLAWWTAALKAAREESLRQAA